MDSRNSQNLELIRVSFDREYYHLYNNMVDWCYQEFGPGNWNHKIGATHKWSVESLFGFSHFYFRDPRDAILFGLKWR